MTYGSIQNARIKYDEKEINSYISSIFSISCISFFVILVFGIIFRKYLSSILGIRQDLVILVIIQSFFSYATGVYLSKLDNFKQVERSTIISVSQSLFVVIISLIIVMSSKGNRAVARIYSGAIEL